MKQFQNQWTLDLSFDKTMASQTEKWHQQALWWGKHGWLIPVQALATKAYMHNVPTVELMDSIDAHKLLWLKIIQGNWESCDYYQSGPMPLD